ncbi:GT-D fold domain-containing protein, partial [Desulfovibrio sp. OttesenSCG-928-A18]|nr:GT-D fold domain-containing protein [Desulfovibrio sp. OttesenSCG-928-A18]
MKTFFKNLKFLFRSDLKNSLALLGDSYPENLQYELYDTFKKNDLKLPTVKTNLETLDLVLSSGKSVARFGDGEFRLLFNKDIPFQKSSGLLSVRFAEILRNDVPGVLVGIPDAFGSLAHAGSTWRFWRRFMQSYRQDIYNFLNFDSVYVDTGFARSSVAVRAADGRLALERLKGLWADRDLVIIEGTKTKFGIGNDLLAKAASVRRIVAPPYDAFDKYDAILAEACKIEKNCLILAPLGPTATVLCHDLGKAGYQAVDIGHLDIEYEWILRGIRKSPVQGKHTNESPGNSRKQADSVVSIMDTEH